MERWLCVSNSVTVHIPANCGLGFLELNIMKKKLTCLFGNFKKEITLSLNQSSLIFGPYNFFLYLSFVVLLASKFLMLSFEPGLGSSFTQNDKCL